MRAGDFAGAWRVSDRVLRARGCVQDQALPRHLQQLWDGRALVGRRVLVHCYHGLGDTLQFIRFVPRLREVAAEVTTWVQPSLIPLLRTIPEVGRLMPLHDAAPGWHRDADVELMELAHFFRATPATLPASAPCIEAPRAELARDPERLAVGLVWQAGDWDPRRSIPPRLLAPLLSDECQWFLLQRGPALAEWPYSCAIDAGSDDPLAAAGVMRALDLVISVDSFPAHLAAAAGVPVWTLLPEPSDWRWMDDRGDSPWYPGMRLFRQPRPGDWCSVIARVARELQDQTASAVLLEKTS